MNLVELNSVGCLIDVEEQLIYPQLDNGLPDFEVDVSIWDIVDDWVAELSDKDFDVVSSIIKSKCPTTYNRLICNRNNWGLNLDYVG